jgi:hypothetical protein
MDPDPGGPKTCGSGSATLVRGMDPDPDPSILLIRKTLIPTVL